MALIASILGLTDAVGLSGTQASGSATAAIAITPGRQMAINATQDLNIRFSTRSGTGTAAVAADFRIPANQTFTFTIPSGIGWMSLFNGSGSSATYYWTYLDKF